MISFAGKGLGRVERGSPKGHFSWAMKNPTIQTGELPEKTGLGGMSSTMGWPGFKVFIGVEDELGKVIGGMFSKVLNALLRLGSFIPFYSFVPLRRFSA